MSRLGLYQCEICLTEDEGEQWGIIPVEIEAVEGLTNFYIEDDVVSFVVHPYCMNEAVEVLAKLFPGERVEYQIEVMIEETDNNMFTLEQTVTV